jgi:RNA polymerase sigma-70 factor (ECF subfamily)
MVMQQSADQARTVDVDREFHDVTEPFRRELMAHCYRMLGSVHDAEDTLQETYLRAWRAYDRFEGRSSVRTWLYRIATNACLTALDGRERRPLPTGLGAPNADPDDALVDRPEVPWLEPVPDVAVGAASEDPASIVTSRESVRLALVAAVQHLPPRQRAVLLLRDVLRWHAAEVADLLGTSTAAVNSSLQRARAVLDRAGLTPETVVEPSEPRRRDLLDRYARALQDKDVAGLVELLTEDAVWEMPPAEAWYRGRRDIARLVDRRCPAGPGQLHLVPVAANGQDGFAVYRRGADGAWSAFQLHVLTLAGDRITHVTSFRDVRLFRAFGLPLVLSAPPPRPLHAGPS